MVATLCKPSEADLGRYALPRLVPVACREMVMSAASIPLANSIATRIIVTDTFFMSVSSG